MKSNSYRKYGNIFLPRALGYDVTRPSPKRRRSYLPALDEDRLITSYDRAQLRKESRNQYRNNPLCRAICERIATASIGGYGLIPQTESGDWGQRMEQVFANWEKVADYRGRADLVDLQRLAVLALLIDGEFFAIKLENGQVQPIEAERIFTPKKFANDTNVIDGVRLDDNGKIQGYYVASRNPQGFADADNAVYIEAKDMIHIRRHERIDAIRGIPHLSPALEKLIDLHETESALLMKIKGEAKRGFAIKSDSAEVGGGNLGDRYSGLTATSNSTTETQYESIMDSSVYYLGEGETIDALETKSPNANHDAYVQQLIVDICSCLGVSAEWVLNKFSTSYIASRASLLTTQQTIEGYQLILEIQLMQPLWNFTVWKSVNSGKIDFPSKDENGNVNWFKVNWIFNKIPSLDESAEAQADEKQWLNATTSLTRLAKQRGVDFKTVIGERIDEAKFIVEAARENNIPLWLIFPPKSGIPISNYDGLQGENTK